MLNHFKAFAAYNEWANQRLYAAAAALTEEDYRADRGAFFGSVHRTLNHLLVTDRIWMHRLTGEGTTYTSLDVVACDHLDQLGAQRAAEDIRIRQWVSSLSEESFRQTITYRMISTPVEVTQRIGPALAHLFNHQTHHRGQVHGLLTAIGGRQAAPSLDMVLFQRETGLAAS